MLLSIKTKLKLSKAQSVVMSKHAGIARFTYNWGLATWNSLYKEVIKPNKYLLKKFFNNHVKPEFTWIKETGILRFIGYESSVMFSVTSINACKQVPVRERRKPRLFRGIRRGHTRPG